MSVLMRIQAWESGRCLVPFQRALDWALYNESGGAFDRSMPGVADGRFDTIALKHAVGISDDPADSGGFTKFGIAQNAHPDIDVRSMTLAQASQIYAAQYWHPLRCDDLPEAVAIMVFDAACGSGIRVAAQALQRALGIEDDGVIGPQTIAAAKAMDQMLLCERIKQKRFDFFDSIVARRPSNVKFLPGWKRRASFLKFGERE